MLKELKFNPQLETLLPEAYAILNSSNLVVHESVSSIILHGSRGLANRARLNSDIDLSLMVDDTALSACSDKEALLHEVSETTLSHWRGPVELDLATVFDIRHCGLKCFDQNYRDEQFCKQGGRDCFGLYKTQKGFHGLVVNAGVEVKRMHPCLKIWQRG